MSFQGFLIIFDMVTNITLCKPAVNVHRIYGSTSLRIVSLKVYQESLDFILLFCLQIVPRVYDGWTVQ